jgi:hypothetical protein
MTTRAHVAVAIVAIATLLVIFRMLRQQQLRSKYALLWTAIALLLLPLAAWPALLVRVSDAIGVKYAPTTGVLVACGFLFAVVVHYSWELSRLETRTRVLAEDVALLRSRLEELHGARSPEARTPDGLG